MPWVYLALIAYFLDAIVFAFDKFLLMAPLPQTLPYAFYATILSVLVVVLLPFGVHLPPSPLYLVVAFSSGLFFFLALIYFYKVIKAIDVLEATPAVGAIAALATFCLSVFILREHISGRELIAFFLLVAGTFIMSYFHLRTRVILYMLLAGIFFGVSSVALKYIFNLSSFIDGLFWSRLGSVISALAILVYSPARRQILNSFGAAPAGSKFLFGLNKVLAAAGFLVLYYAIKLGSVVFVNALQGLQYVFILIIGIFVAKKLPMLFEKHLHEKLARKVIATILIVVGFFFLVF
jgi:drug/metabolite transporter (DMT)-like permease